MRKTHHEIINETEQKHWWYRVRRQLIHKLVSQHFPNKNDLKIIDLGCGTGLLMTELQGYGMVNGVDISKDAIEFCKNKGLNNVKVSDIENLEYSDDSFDMVLLLDVLEHTKNDSRVLQEARRILKPNGKIIVFVPCFMFLWGITDVVSEHFRRYTLKEIRTLVVNQSLIILDSSYFNFLLFLPIAIFRLLVRVFRIDIKSENNLGNSLTNYIMYNIFKSELAFLPAISFPFGVSCYLVCTKK